MSLDPSLLSVLCGFTGMEMARLGEQDLFFWGDGLLLHIKKVIDFHITKKKIYLANFKHLLISFVTWGVHTTLKLYTKRDRIHICLSWWGWGTVPLLETILNLALSCYIFICIFILHHFLLSHLFSSSQYRTIKQVTCLTLITTFTLSCIY